MKAKGKAVSRLLAELLVLPPQSHVLLVQLVEGADGAIAAPRSTRTTSGDGSQPPRSQHDDGRVWPEGLAAFPKLLSNALFFFRFSNVF